MNDRTKDLFDSITEKLIAALEKAAQWNQPWSFSSLHGFPRNASTKKHYEGINVVALWMEQADKGFATSWWATYKQWEAMGAQVRKGEHGSGGVKWVISYKCETCGVKSTSAPCARPGHDVRRSMFPSTFTVFNADQVDGWAPPTEAVKTDVERDADIEIEAWVATLPNLKLHFGGNSAHYRPGTNDVTLPESRAFATSQGYYGTLFHELTHWTGDASRLDRAQKNPFGSERYAAEELVAELGSAFLGAHFGIEVEPHAEHASYLKSWLRVLRSDTMALYNASKYAAAAANFLIGGAVPKAKATVGESKKTSDKEAVAA